MKKQTTFKPTLFQHLATDYRRNMAVTAGAGTGKTEVLTRRIVRILGREKHYLDRLMVLTFTDKAAVEMKERIYLAIEKELGKTGMPHFQKLKDTFLNNYISTIHSFCAALLREYPIEAGVDPYFRVLDETEKIFFLRRSINRSLRELAAKRDDPDIGLLSEEFSRASIAGAIFNLIQKREDTGAWLEHFESLKWPQYRNSLRLYRNCILSEICYKLYKEGVLQRHLSTLEMIRAGVQDCGYKVDSTLNNAIVLLKAMVAELKKKVLLSNQLGGDKNSTDFDIREISRLRTVLLGTLKLTGSPPKNWPEETYANLRWHINATRYLLEAFPCDEFEIAEEQEKQGFSLLKALARTTRYCLQAYHNQKNEENYLDFQDLQLRLERLLAEEKNNHILNELRERFRYIMVDEFQDTNDLQWKIIKMIAADSSGLIVNPRVFVVGDEKQAIYSFRGGDVRLFSRVRRELRKANRDHGYSDLPFELQPEKSLNYEVEYCAEISDDTPERSGEIIFADNFRSAAGPINFFNLFFEDLFYREVYEEHDARPQLLRCAGNKTTGSIELLLVDKSDTNESAMDFVPGRDGEESGDSPEEKDNAEPVLKPHFKEALLIADKIREVFMSDDPQYRRVRDNAAEGRPAIAILLNRRTMIKTYEEALRLNRITFSVVRGRGFFQRREIVDLGNLLNLMVDRCDDLALCGFLRSPAGHLSDEAIFLLTRAVRGSTLWDRLMDCSKALANIPGGVEQAADENAFNRPCVEEAFTASDRRALITAASNLQRWWILSQRLPLVEFLRLVLAEGGYYVSLGRGNRGEQAISNIEKVVDNARELALQENINLAGFAEWLNNRIDHVEEEGEADIDISLGGAVQIMTVHQSKGLEFPMVFVPDLGASFNYGERESIFSDMVPLKMTISEGGIDRSERVEIGVDAPNPENDWESEPILIKRIIKKRLRDKITAEKKRLFYVASTRAMDHLILVGNANWDSERLLRRIDFMPLDLLSSWLEWLNQILRISRSIEGKRGMIRYVNRSGLSMKIPYRMFSDEGKLTGSEEEYRIDFPLEDKLFK